MNQNVDIYGRWIEGVAERLCKEQFIAQMSEDDTIVINLIKILIEGPDVSLNGSPTVSPTTEAL